MIHQCSKVLIFGRCTRHLTLGLDFTLVEKLIAGRHLSRVLICIKLKCDVNESYLPCYKLILNVYITVRQIDKIYVKVRHVDLFTEHTLEGSSSDRL